MEKPLTIYKQHQIATDELEIGAIGTDFSWRTSWWARENLGRSRTWKSMKNIHFSEIYTNERRNQHLIKIIDFWMKLGASCTRR
jgi:hypothetical protein